MPSFLSRCIKIVNIGSHLHTMINSIPSLDYHRDTQSPTIFSQILHNDFKDLSFPGGSTLIQYVDDLLLASPSAATCETDTMVLLLAMAVRGHKTSRKKAQLCQPVVQYVGYTLSGPTRVLTPSRVKPH